MTKTGPVRRKTWNPARGQTYERLAYDLPTDTAGQRAAYTRFRKQLIRAGFIMFEKSVYVKLLRNVSSVRDELVKTRSLLPSSGTVHVLPMSLGEFRGHVTLLGKPFRMDRFADDIVWI